MGGGVLKGLVHRGEPIGAEGICIIYNLLGLSEPYTAV